MADKRDYYDVLGINRNASQDDIKSAFRSLAREYHPDVNKSHDAEERFKEINEAYGVLSDPDKRAAYDRFGFQGVNTSGMPNYADINLSDLLDSLFGFGMGGFGGFGSRSTRSANAPRRGDDLSTRLKLSFEEAVFGTDKEVSINRHERCSHCGGNGAEPGTRIVTRQTCHGQEKCARCNKPF